MPGDLGQTGSLALSSEEAWKKVRVEVESDGIIRRTEVTYKDGYPDVHMIPGISDVLTEKERSSRMTLWAVRGLMGTTVLSTRGTRLRLVPGNRGGEEGGGKKVAGRL